MPAMSTWGEVIAVSAVGLGTTSSVPLGVAIGLYVESIHKGGSLVVLPTVAGFLLALYMPLVAASV